MSLGRVFAGEQDLEGDGAGGRGGCRKCQDSMFRHFPLCSIPGGVLCLGEGSCVAVAFSLCATPKWHLLITLMPGPKLDLPPHTAQLLRSRLMLGPGLPSVIKAGPAFFFLCLSSARRISHHFLCLSWEWMFLPLIKKEKGNCSSLFPPIRDLKQTVFKLNLLLVLGMLLSGWDSASRLLNTLLCCALVSSSIKWGQ